MKMNKLFKCSVIICGLFTDSSEWMQEWKHTKTIVTVKGDKWFLNDRIINEGSPSEGLLMNVRMINSVFEDRGDKLPAEFSDFDPESNTNSFVSKIPDYMASGVNGFTIGLQGGMPGYEGAINSAFETDGTLRPEYMQRVERIIRAVDENSGVVILSCFYQRQHSHNAALNSREDIKNAVKNTIKWIKKNRFRNVVLEISNEYRHGGYRNWKEGRWLMSTSGQVEMISYAKSMDPSLLISTSGMGDGRLNDSLSAAVDFVTIHFNTTSLEDYSARINELKKTGKPLICNEDDKTGKAGAGALILSVVNGCGWGYMNNAQNQYMPFRFEGVNDDTVVYNMFRKVITPGSQIDVNSYLKENELLESKKVKIVVQDGEI